MDTNIAGADGPGQIFSGSGREWTQTLRERTVLVRYSAGAGGSGQTLRERTVLVRYSAGAGGCVFKKTVPRRALRYTPSSAEHDSTKVSNRGGRYGKNIISRFFF